MSNKIWKSVFVVCAAGCLASCSDQMDYNEYNIFDKDYITQNFGNVGGFMTDIYNTVDYDFGNYSSGAMQASATDESEYSLLGNGIEHFYNGFGALPMQRRQSGVACIKASVLATT